MSAVRARLSGAVGVIRALPPSVGLALSVLIVLLLAGLFGPLPYDPLRPVPGQTFQPPSSAHWFGTDGTGSDVFSRTISAAGLDLPLAVGGMLISLLIGVPLGLAASIRSRWAEQLMRGVDMLQAFPLLVLAIAIVALTGNQLRNIIVAIGLVNVPRFLRLVRSEALAVRELRFVQAAEAVGASQMRIMGLHILPNITGTIFAQASLATAHAIVVIAALSYLGIGVRPPQASWGAMIRSGAENMTTGQWWGWAFPGLAVLIVVLSLNHAAEWLNSRFARTSDLRRR